MLEFLLILELALLAVCTGFLAGVLGIGGGMITIPFVTDILLRRGVSANLAVKMAIATAMASVIFVSVSNVRAQHQRGSIRWDIFRHIAPGNVLGALFTGLVLFDLVKGQWLAIFFGIFIGYSATRMLTAHPPLATKTLPSAFQQGLMGIMIGCVCGLVGAGGAFISVPYMTARNVPIHNAIATSAALGMPIALINTCGFIYSGWGKQGLPDYTLGFVYLPALLILATIGAVMAPIGVKYSHRMPTRILKRFFAVLLYAQALYMLWQGLTS